MRRGRPSLVTAGIAVLALAGLALPANAPADHLVATASIDGTLGPAKRSGTHVLTVRWNATCSDPDATVLVTIGRVIRPKDPARKPVFIDGAEAEEQGAGSARIEVSSGARFVPTITVECSLSPDDGTTHRAEASANGPELYAPPRLTGYRVLNTTTCGDAAIGPRSFDKLQVGQQMTIEPIAAYNSLSMLRRPRSVKGIRLRIKGAGLNARRKLTKSRGTLGFVLPRPRRAGRLRIWLVFDGTPSNRLSVRVLSRRGC